MNKENKKVPKLRFPEFVNEGEWGNRSIGEVFNSFSGGTPNTTEKEYYGGKIPFIRSAEINKDITELYLTDKGIKNSSAKLVNIGDLLVALYGANSGDSAISKMNGAINQAILCLQSEFSNKFVYNFLTLKKDWIVSRFIQGGQGNISGDIVKSILIPFPTKHEQQKIASCLSSLDELITAHTNKLEALKDHKKGLMQQLFPAEGETVPKLRFKEFEKDGEWVETTLGEVSDYENGKAHENDIIDNGNYILVNSKFISTDGEVRKFTNSPYCLASKEDILMVLSDVPNGRAIAKCFLVEQNNLYTVNQRVCKLTPKGIVSVMLFYVLNRHSFLLAFDDGVKQTNLRKEDVLNCSLILPNSTKEQQKIASFLSSIDDEITAQTHKIETLKEHKKGLMQGLFPVINE